MDEEKTGKALMIWRRGKNRVGEPQEKKTGLLLK